MNLSINFKPYPIKTISIREEEYPSSLKNIQDPPKVIYIRGTLPTKSEICFAIVGTRKCSPYGKQIASEIAQDLAEAGLTIVSGLAPGIDTSVHKAVVKRKRKTIAVLGTGLDPKSIYPKTNLGLAKEILDTGGCLISEYKPDIHGSKFTFPQRNRIIAGLSVGVLVVEAPLKSGALITANWAFLQNKKVFAVPASVYSTRSKGCHFLIKKGAKLVESSEDILCELEIEKEKRHKPTSGIKSKEEKIILDVLNQPMHIDKIIEKTGLPVSSVNKTLAILEIEGKVRNLGGNTYALGNR